MPEIVGNISVPAHITAVAYSAARGDIAYATRHRITWNLARGDEDFFDHRNVVAMAFSPGGEWLAYVTDAGQCGVFSRDPNVLYEDEGPLAGLHWVTMLALVSGLAGLPPPIG